MTVHNTPIAYMVQQSERAGKTKRLQRRKPAKKKEYAAAKEFNARNGIGPDHYQPPKWKLRGRQSKRKVTLPVIKL